MLIIDPIEFRLQNQQLFLGLSAETVPNKMSATKGPSQFVTTENLRDNTPSSFPKSWSFKLFLPARL